MHSAQHAGDELVDTVTLLYEAHQSGYPALIVTSALKMREDEFLESIDLVLERHEIGDSFIAIMFNQRSDTSNQEDIETNPSLGSLMVFKLMYSSYSNKPRLGSSVT